MPDETVFNERHIERLQNSMIFLINNGRNSEKSGLRNEKNKHRKIKSNTLFTSVNMARI